MARSGPLQNSVVSFLALAVVSLVLAVVVRNQYVNYYSTLALSSDILIFNKNSPANISVPPTPIVAVKSPISLPLKVPFTPQAPLAVWDPLHEEACEEASLLMVYYFRTGQKFASPAAAEMEIKKLTAWEESNGYKVDLTAKELVAVASGYLKTKTGRVITDPTVEGLKSELEAGRPVIVPAAGRELKNPYFTPPGPVYHMLVLIGYDETGFSVNDPGTRHGENYHYAFKSIMEAIHDWDPDNILNGQKAVVVFD